MYIYVCLSYKNVCLETEDPFLLITLLVKENSHADLHSNTTGVCVCDVQQNVYLFRVRILKELKGCVRV